MRKVYLIKCIDINEEHSKSFIDEVFSNRKNAEAYVRFANKETFSSYYYWVEERKICKTDYTFLAETDI